MEAPIPSNTSFSITIATQNVRKNLACLLDKVVLECAHVWLLTEISEHGINDDTLHRLSVDYPQWTLEWVKGSRVAVLVHISVPYKVIHHYTRTCLVHLPQTDNHIAAIYGSCLPQERKDILENEIIPILTNYPSVMFGGDWNGTMDHTLDSTTVTPNNWAALRDLHLIDPFRVHYPQQRSHTRVRGYGTSCSRLDYFLTTHTFFDKFPPLSVEHIDFHVSDHTATRITLTTPNQHLPLHYKRTPPPPAPIPITAKHVPMEVIRSLSDIDITWIPDATQLSAPVVSTALTTLCHHIHSTLKIRLRSQGSHPPTTWQQHKENLQQAFTQPNAMSSVKHALHPTIPITTLYDHTAQQYLHDEKAAQYAATSFNTFGWQAPADIPAALQWL
jgi:hypothetical protein